MQKQLKTYFKTIKKNLPCYNKTMRQMLDDLKLSVETYIKDNDIACFDEITEHFGTAEDIAKEFAIGLDNAYVKSYKFKKRVATITISIFAVILIMVASLSIYIYIENERHSPVNFDTNINYKDGA